MNDLAKKKALERVQSYRKNREKWLEMAERLEGEGRIWQSEVCMEKALSFETMIADTKKEYGV